MTNIDMNVERCEMNQGACDMTADELELVSGGDYVGHAAKSEGTAPMSIGGAIMGAINICSVS
jgi:hypothetical protein